jgi:hypothetical protein
VKERCRGAREIFHNGAYARLRRFLNKAAGMVIYQRITD